MGPRAAFVIALCWASAAAAAPRCRLSGRPYLEARVAGSPLIRTVDARRGQEVEVFLVAPGTLDGRPVLFSDDGTRGRTSYAAAGCGRLRVTWRRVEPRPQHRGTPAPNADLPIYANAQVFGPQHGRWLGFDHVDYDELLLPGDAPRLTLREVPRLPPWPARLPAHEALGTLRLAATVQPEPHDAPAEPPRDTAGAREAREASSTLTTGRAEPLRLSFREGDGFLGWLTSFYNVPYLFGSAGQGARSQAERYVGADCADVLVAALRRAGRRDLDYTSVGGLVDALGPLPLPFAELPTPAGAAHLAIDPPSSPPRPGALRPGDILGIDYVGSGDLPRALDHIVVLYADRGPGGVPDGVLGPDDLVADSGDGLALKIAPLSQQGHIRVRAARPRGVLIGPD